MSPAVLDLFRGAGGWSVACRDKGMDEYGVECMKEANATAEAAGFKTAFLDVWEPPFWVSAVLWTGLIASPPCQTFSQAGSGAGRKALDDVLRAIKDERWRTLEDLKALGEEVGDDRTALVLTPLWYARNLNPEWIALEQVPSVLPVWEAMAEVLRNMGYNVWTGKLHAEQYGVPQARTRAILIASRVREVHKPVPTHSLYHRRSPERLDEGVLPWVTMAEALGWTEDSVMVSNYGTGGDPRNRGTRTGDQPAPTVTSKIDRNKVVPAWTLNRPSTTIVGTFRPDVVAAPGYRTTVSRQNAPDSARVTAHEAGVLQSFPADYPWQGSKTKQYLQAGNAIPPLLARAILDVVQP